MKIAVRMDDITPDMDWTKFLRFKELCDQYRIKPLIGIVPDNRDSALHIQAPDSAPVKDFWTYVRQLEQDGWSIAQHGVHHTYTTKRMGCFPLNRLSEFAGIPYEKQYTLLRKGKEILKNHGIETDLFMAPAHSFDRHTIKALRELGFHGLTDGFGDRPYSMWGMTFYPISYRQSSVFQKEKGCTTFVVHTNVMEEKDFARYEQMFANCRDRLISYRMLLDIAPEKRGLIGKIREYVMAVAKFCIIRMKRG